MRREASVGTPEVPGHLVPVLSSRTRLCEEGGRVVIVVPRYSPRLRRLLRTLRLPTERRIVLDERGSGAIRKVNGKRSVVEIARAIRPGDEEEPRRLVVFLAQLGAFGLVSFR